MAQFPFGIGDELVSMDGRPVQEVIQSFRKYAIAANQRSTERVAAARMVSRSQQIMPHIHELGATATLVLRMQTAPRSDRRVLRLGRRHAARDYSEQQPGPIFGWRTMGAGGSVVGFPGPAFTESIFSITVSLMNRGHIVTTPDFPPAPYIENIGVRPDIPVDYMTRANLMNGGAPFVLAFIQALENLVHP